MMNAFLPPVKRKPLQKNEAVKVHPIACTFGVSNIYLILHITSDNVFYYYQQSQYIKQLIRTMFGDIQPGIHLKLFLLIYPGQSSTLLLEFLSQIKNERGFGMPKAFSKTLMAGILIIDLVFELWRNKWWKQRLWPLVFQSRLVFWSRYSQSKKFDSWFLPALADRRFVVDLIFRTSGNAMFVLLHEKTRN